MDNVINKKLIKKRFEKSFSTYADNAFIQEKISKELLLKLIEFQGDKFDRIFEIGCGTGLLTKKLLSSLIFNELFINDIVKQSVDEVAKFSDKTRKVYGDCEEVPFPSNLNAIISNATFQWLADLDLIFDKAYSSLNFKSTFAFTTFGEDNFNQIKAITAKSLNYYNKKSIENLLKDKFNIVYSNSEIINLEFDNTLEILKHLKLSGVNAITSKKWTKKDLQDFSEKYERLFKNPNGKLILTYQPLYFIAEKK